jgi:excisionase family DNA binding protein
MAREIETTALKGEFLTADEAVKLLNGLIGRTLLYRCLKAGQLPARKLGNKYLIHRPKLEAWLRGDDPRAAQ